MEALYWMRLVLIFVGFVAAIATWSVSSLSDLFLVKKLNFVTNSERYYQSIGVEGNSMYYFNISGTYLSTENFKNNSTGFLNVTAASHAATSYANSAGNYNYGIKAFGYFLGFNMLFTVLAFIPVCYRPVAGGSGIAEAKSVLNGVILPACTDMLTGLCKAFSIIFAGAASLPIGLEGPLIFIGLIIGDNAQRFIPKEYPALKVDELKRDFAVVGCACGVTGAFLTPVGGVLFAMEEGASFWNPLLAWRSFASACVTAIAIYFFKWAISLVKVIISGNPIDSIDKGIMNVHDMAIYSGLPMERDVESAQYVIPTFRIYDFFVFALMGIIAGVFGALWIQANCYITKFRQKFIGSNRVKKFIELVTLSILVTCVLWFIPLLYTVCKPNEAIQKSDYSILRQSNCPNSYYNELSTLFLNSPGGIGLNLMYWEPSIAFEPSTMFIAGMCYHILLLLLFGSSTAMGIFIPLLYIGALYGRAATQLIIYTTDFIPNDMNRQNVLVAYTMVASVAVLAGVVRVLISITVIIICTTGVTYMITPFMVATVFAKVIGKALLGTPGIYDCIIETKGIPFLETECPKCVSLRGLCARDIMSKDPLISLKPEQELNDLLICLEKYPGIADYPVIESSSLHRDILIGVITKSAILTILSHKSLFYDSGDCGKDKARRALKFDQMIYERVKKVNVDINTVLNTVTKEDRESKMIDLTPYVEIGHYSVNQYVSVNRAYELFRSLGLRILIVTDAHGIPIGVITRHDLKLLEDVGIEEAEYVKRLSDLSYAKSNEFYS